jgi:hypothetical protein
MHLSLSESDLAPIVEAAVARVLDRFGSDAARVCYPEREAAALLGVKSHVLRDARLRAEIVGSKIGRGYSYSRADLVRWFDSRRED